VAEHVAVSRSIGYILDVRIIETMRGGVEEKKKEERGSLYSPLSLVAPLPRFCHKLKV